MMSALVPHFRNNATFNKVVQLILHPHCKAPPLMVIDAVPKMYFVPSQDLIDNPVCKHWL